MIPETSGTETKAGAAGFSRWRTALVLLFVWALSGVYLGANLMRGWVPHDEGALGQSAEWVLQGRLPHLDFTEIYTGGLSWLNALAFYLFGTNLGSPRILLFLFFLAWVPALFFLARECMGDAAAAGVTLMAAAWSVPLYPAAMPSWYNLFFATFGAVALFRYVKKPDRRWLFAAGLCGGVSFLMKIVALYYVAAVLLYLIYREQSEELAGGAGEERSSRGYSAFLVAGLAIFAGLIVALVRIRIGARELLYEVAPSAALALFLLAREWRGKKRRRAGSRERFLAFGRMAAPFLLGVLLPIALFMIPYLRAHAWKAFLNGVFLLPFKRMLGAFMRPPEVLMLLPALGFAVLLALGFWLKGRWRLVLSLGAALGWAFLVWMSFSNETAYGLAWHAVRGGVPVVAVAGSGMLWAWARIPGLAGEGQKQRIMILLSMGAACSLVEIPFAAPVYFCYTAPLVLLAVAALLAVPPKPPRLLLASAGIFVALFAVLVVRPGDVFHLGKEYQEDEQTESLDLPRAGKLKIPEEDAEVYAKLMDVIQEHGEEGELLAGPDSPEVYFLGGFENPRRDIFEMFEDVKGYQENTERLLEKESVKVVVINNKPGFSPYLGEVLQKAAEKRFPQSMQIGRFEVRWRE